MSEENPRNYEPSAAGDAPPVTQLNLEDADAPVDINFDADAPPRRLTPAKKVLLVTLLAAIVVGALGLFIRSRRAIKTVDLPAQAAAPGGQQTNNGQLAQDLLSQQASPTPGAPAITDPTQLVNPATASASPAPGFAPSTIFQADKTNPNTPVTQAREKDAADIYNKSVAETQRLSAGGGISGSGGGGSGGNPFGASGGSSSGISAAATSPDTSAASLPKQPSSSSSAATTTIVFRNPGTAASPAAQNLVNQVAPLRGANGAVIANRQIPFGTMLPVRTLGTIHTLFSNSLARLELTRDVRGDGWSLPEHTVIVAKASGSNGDRIYLSPQGFISADEKFYPLQGEITGTDGATGLPGERKTIGSRWYKVVLNAADRAQQILVAWLQSRGGGNITNIEVPRSSDIVNQDQSQVVRYVLVNGRTDGYLMITALPESVGNTAALPNLDASGSNLGLDQLDQILRNPAQVVPQP